MRARKKRGYCSSITEAGIIKEDKYVCGPRDDAQVSVQTGREGKRGEEGSQGGPREDKERSRSKNSIISADARTSLGFPGADNGALFEESFCVRPRYSGIRSFPASPLTHPLPLTRARYTCSPLFFRDFSFVLSNKNSKLLADERG